MVECSSEITQLYELQINDVSEIERDQLLCVGNKGFMQPKDSRQNVEIKANWGRARKQYGPNATDIVVSATMNPTIDVSSSQAKYSLGISSIIFP